MVHRSYDAAELNTIIAHRLRACASVYTRSEIDSAGLQKDASRARVLPRPLKRLFSCAPVESREVGLDHALLQDLI